MTDLTRYPSVHYLRDRAHKRIPHFSWEMLDSSTGMELGKERNESELQKIELVPKMLPGDVEAETKTSVLGFEYDAPFGVAPVGLSGLIWPEAEKYLARAAAERKILWAEHRWRGDAGDDRATGGRLRLVSVLPHKRTEGPRRHSSPWQGSRFQGADHHHRCADHQHPRTPIEGRAEDAPPRNLETFWNVAKRPTWAAATLKRGEPKLVTLEKYESDNFDMRAFLAKLLHGRPTWDDVERVRDVWDGPVIVKGVMDVGDAVESVKRGFDGIVVSNHGARQCDGVPATISVLPEIAAEVGGKTDIIFDSGLRTGLDIVRARALGADFCLLGRPFLYAVAALGEEGAGHVMKVLKDDYANNMIQLGVKNVDELRTLKLRGRPTPTNW